MKALIVLYYCNNCEADVETRYHCSVCYDYDLCFKCYGDLCHPHELKKLKDDSFSSDEKETNSGYSSDESETKCGDSSDEKETKCGGSTSDEKQTNGGESRREGIKRCTESLLHACQCRDASCENVSCSKMKRVVQHANSCKRKTNGGCPICKQLIALCCYHAKHCAVKKCPVPFCVSIKHKLKQQHIQAGVEERQMLKRRRISTANNTE